MIVYFLLSPEMNYQDLFILISVLNGQNFELYVSAKYRIFRNISISQNETCLFLFLCAYNVTKYV